MNFAVEPGCEVDLACCSSEWNVSSVEFLDLAADLVPGFINAALRECLPLGLSELCLEGCSVGFAEDEFSFVVRDGVTH